MKQLDDLSFAICDVSTEEIKKVDPDQSKEIPHPGMERGFAEKATTYLYEHQFNYAVENINQRRKRNRLKYALGIDETNRSQSWDMPAELGEHVVQLLQDHLDVRSGKKALQTASVDGIPDLLACRRDNYRDFQFIEAKRGRENLLQSQVDWFDKFDFFTIKIAFVFDSQDRCEVFIDEYDMKDLRARAGKVKNLEDMEDRVKLSNAEIATRLENLAVGDRITFNERAKPLEVVETDKTWVVRGEEESGVELRSGSGNRYLLTHSGDSYIEKENRRPLNWVPRIDER